MCKRVAVGDNFRLDHFSEKVVAFTRSFSDTCEHRKSLTPLGHVVDQFHDQNGLSNTGTAEQTDLSTSKERLHKVDDLNSRLEHLKRCRLFVERRCMSMDGITNVGIHGAKFVHRIANNVHYTSKRCSANRYRDSAA
jgi:hypothetical protein